MQYQAVSIRRSSSGVDVTAAVPTTAVEAYRASLRALAMPLPWV
jgi:hypothetical protein